MDHKVIPLPLASLEAHGPPLSAKMLIVNARVGIVEAMNQAFRAGDTARLESLAQTNFELLQAQLGVL